MPYSIVHWLFLVLVMALASLDASGASQFEGSPWTLLDVQKVRETSAGITPQKYPDCDEAVVNRRTVTVYRADGTAETQEEAFKKVLTEKGKRENRTLTFGFMLPYETVECVKLELLKPDGRTVPMDVAANSKEMIDDSQMASNIYDPNTKVLQVNVPGVEVGDVVHSVTRTHTVRSYIPGEWSSISLFEYTGLIKIETYEVHAPADKPLKKIVLRDEVPGTIHYSEKPDANGGKVHLWEAKEVPRMFDEPNMPSLDTVVQRVLLSTTPDWPYVSKWYWRVCLPHLEAASPEMEQQVAELTAGATSDRAKIEALFYFVSQKIRYMGLTTEKDRPGFEPHDVRITFANKYGVCRDKAALLVEMLRLAGFKAYPVIINVGSMKDMDVPNPDFNHAIVGVELEKSEYTLMDPTDENTKELFPAYLCHQSFLVSKPEGETLMTTPIIPATANLMRVKTTATLEAGGTFKGASELRFEGFNDNVFRGEFARMKPDERRRFFETILKSAIPGARLQSLQLTPEDMLDTSTVVKAELGYTAEGVTALGDGKAIASLPWLGKNLGLVNYILGGLGLEKRKYPLKTWYACGVQEEISIQLDHGFAGPVSLPSGEPREDECVAFKQRVEFKDQSLACSREFLLKVVEFSPAQYLKLKESLKAMEYESRKAPVLTVSKAVIDQSGDREVESDAEFLESRTDLEMRDATTAVRRTQFKKQVLSYNGKKSEAELMIHFNPAWQEAEIKRGVVVSKSGQRQEIAPTEINLMDEWWNASAKRYTGGKILVANLPGVDIGSTIEVEYEVRSRNKPFQAGFEPFQSFDQIDEKSFQLIAPVPLSVHTMITGLPGSVAETGSTNNGVLTHRWTTQGNKALPSEQELPPYWTFLPGVLYHVGDMKTYLRELNETLLDRSSQRAKARAEAEKLMAQVQGKLDKLVAIRDFVAKFIRTAGPSFTELPLKELSAADTTLQDGYGHGADKAILLHALLTSAGFTPEFVVVSSLPEIAGITNTVESFPMPQLFNQLLVKVTVNDATYYLNDTDQYARIGSTQSDGRLGIRLADQAFETIHPTPECADKVETRYRMTVAADGKTRITLTRAYYGSSFDSKNRFFSELPPEERRRYHQTIVADMAQGAKPLDDLVTRFDTYPGLEEFTVEIAQYAVVDQKFIYFKLPYQLSLFPSGTDQRKLPLFRGWASDQVIRTEIELPRGFAQVDIAPKNQTLAAPKGAGEASTRSTATEGKWELTHRLQSAPVILNPEDYPTLLQVQSTLGQLSSRVFLLEKK